MNAIEFTERIYRKKSWPLIVVLLLSAYTHLWNPIGFPTPHGDEAHYIRRAMHVLDGLGPQERGWNDRPYDHPYFGQIFLAAILGLIGYPNSVTPDASLQSIEMLSLVPRILMGLFAVADTFLIYRIAERRYDKNVALITAILFALMPSTWFVRRILLDSLLLPLVLMSILFAINSKKKQNLVHPASSIQQRVGLTKDKWKEKEDKQFSKTNLPLVFLSGIFLGLAIFTKVPSISVAPLVGYLIFTNNAMKWKSLGVWFVPLILIPLIWPFYSFQNNELVSWLNDVFWQAGREGSGLWSFESIFNIDPVLASFGIIGLIYATIRRDFLPLLWVLPFLVFIEFIGFTQSFHWIMVLPALCIAASVLIDAVIKTVNKAILNARIKKASPQRVITDYSNDEFFPGRKPHWFKNLFEESRRYNLLLAIAVLGIGIFGLANTTILIGSNLSSNYFELYSFIIQHLPEYNDDISDRNSTANKVTIIGEKRWLADFLWIPKYIFDKDHDFRGNFLTEDLSLKVPIETEKVLMIVDSRLLKDLSRNGDERHIQQLRNLYNNTKTIGIFKDSEEYLDVHSKRDIYPYTSLSDNRGIGKIEVRTNY